MHWCENKTNKLFYVEGTVVLLHLGRHTVTKLFAIHRVKIKTSIKERPFTVDTIEHFLLVRFKFRQTLAQDQSRLGVRAHLQG